jgi:hypothetical protein
VFSTPVSYIIQAQQLSTMSWYEVRSQEFSTSIVAVELLSCQLSTGGSKLEARSVLLGFWDIAKQKTVIITANR